MTFIIVTKASTPKGQYKVKATKQNSNLSSVLETETIITLDDQAPLRLKEADGVTETNVFALAQVQNIYLPLILR